MSMLLYRLSTDINKNEEAHIQKQKPLLLRLIGLAGQLLSAISKSCKSSNPANPDSPEGVDGFAFTTYPS